MATFERLDQGTFRETSPIPPAPNGNARSPRVFLVNPLTLVREGLRVLLCARGIEVVGGTASLDDALAAALEVTPDVILLDQDLTERTRPIVSNLQRALPLARVAIIVDDESPGLDDVGLQNDGVAQIPRGLSVAEIVFALRAVAAPEAGGSFGARAPMTRWPRKPGRRLRPPRRVPLTARQMTILEALGRGDQDRVIATELRISERTVKTHVRRILEVLHVRNRTQAVAYGLRKGLIR